MPQQNIVVRRQPESPTAIGDGKRSRPFRTRFYLSLTSNCAPAVPGSSTSRPLQYCLHRKRHRQNRLLRLPLGGRVPRSLTPHGLRCGHLSSETKRRLLMTKHQITQPIGEDQAADQRPDWLERFARRFRCGSASARRYLARVSVCGAASGNRQQGRFRIVPRGGQDHHCALRWGRDLPPVEVV
ncbi:hypothetical protein EV132_12628 [Rhizobium sullae]|uniref:Uncharacterized protein n=1 Tax=Rhizobium sullae TaxID=50338 RepID=A0A4R3PTX4_RHISU|nr:hypothetical protein EV132_12628 [Rhizobium sullae]